MEPEGVGDLGESKKDNDGKEWIYTQNGWVMTNDGTGEGQFSGVGDLGWRINGLNIPGVGMDDLTGHYNLLGVTSPGSSGTTSAAGSRPGNYDPTTDQWVYPDGRRMSFSTGNGDAVVVGYQQTGTGNWVSWDTANVLASVNQTSGTRSGGLADISAAGYGAGYESSHRQNDNGYAAIIGDFQRKGALLTNAAIVTEITAAVVIAVPVTVIVAEPVIAVAAAKLRKDLRITGPSPGLAYGNGSIIGVLYQDKTLIRLDYQPLKGRNDGDSVLHLNSDIFPSINHLPIQNAPSNKRGKTW